MSDQLKNFEADNLLPPTSEQISEAISSIDNFVEQNDRWEHINIETRFNFGDLEFFASVLSEFEENESSDIVSIAIYDRKNKSDQAKIFFGIGSDDESNWLFDINGQTELGKTIAHENLASVALSFAYTVMSLSRLQEDEQIKVIKDLSGAHSVFKYCLSQSKEYIEAVLDTFSCQPFSSKDVPGIACTLRDYISNSNFPHSMTNAKLSPHPESDKFDLYEVLSKTDIEVGEDGIRSLNWERSISSKEVHTTTDDDNPVKVNVKKTLTFVSDQEPNVTTLSSPRLDIDSPQDKTTTFMDYFLSIAPNSDLNRSVSKSAVIEDIESFISQIIEIK